MEKGMNKMQMDFLKVSIEMGKDGIYKGKKL